MKTALKNLEKARQEVSNAQIELLGQGVSFFSLTVQDLQDTEEKIREAIVALQRTQVVLENLK